jgi:hypothetical protein
MIVDLLESRPILRIDFWSHSQHEHVEMSTRQPTRLGEDTNPEPRVVGGPAVFAYFRSELRHLSTVRFGNRE